MSRNNNHPTREKILRAATELMWQHGYGRTSPAQVMEASGVGQGSFYHHFPDKRSLGLAVVEDIVRKTGEALETTFSEDLPPMQRIHEWVRLACTRYRPPCDRGCPLGKLGIEMAGEDPAFRDAIASGFGLIRRRFAAALREAGAAGQLEDAVDPDGLAELLLAGIEGAILIAQCDGDGAAMDRSFGQIQLLLDRVERPGLVSRGGIADP